ncbi:hypothetical protein HJC23_006935 [Cyclotella cryptica]|uniref:Uncharacterized protein n=1 Tax=Cyclotella cryptica TaxID=29204 RepID=A0ABD3P644_9STRA
MNQKPLFDTVPCTLNRRMPNQWCMDVSGTPRYLGNTSFDNLAVRRYNHQGIEKCLANKTIVFIGDSRVRYQFLHLAGFLKRNRFMKCQDYDISTNPVHNSSTLDDDCYLIDQKHHASMKANDWKSFYEESTKMTESGHTESNGQQYSLCDCFRSVPFIATTTYENRFIKRKTAYGEVNLIYLQNFVDLVRMNIEYPPFSSFWSEQRCKPGECSASNRTDAFTGNTGNALWLLPSLNATHSFVSQGWGNLSHTDDISCAIKDFEHHHPEIAVYLISHPRRRTDRSSPSVFFDEDKLECKVKSLDRTMMSKDVPLEWYWDDLHVLSIMNEEFNHQLIENICPIM